LLLPRGRLRTVFVSSHSLQVSDKRSSVWAVVRDANAAKVCISNPTNRIIFIHYYRCFTTFYENTTYVGIRLKKRPRS